MTRKAYSSLIIAVAILLLAAALRFTSLHNRNLWFDEGVSLTFSQMPPSDVLRHNILWQDTNPPIYRILLGVWLRPLGVTPFTARAFSAILGILAIPLTYRIARKLHVSRAAGLFAGFLLAIAPMQVYYSREVKHYTFMQVFLLIAVLAWQHLFPASEASARPARSMLWALITAIAVFCAVGAQYMSLIMVLTMGVWLLLVWVDHYQRDKGSIGAALHPSIWWIGPVIVSGLLLLPWVLATAESAAAGTRSAAANIGLVSQSPLQYLIQTTLELGAGPVGSDVFRAALTILLLILVGFGLFAAATNRILRWQLGIWLFVPILLGLVVQRIIPFFYPRFLLFVTPALFILAALGAERLWQMLNQQTRVTVALLIASVATLSAVLIGAQLALPDRQPDLRALATNLQVQLRPGDALVYSYSWQPGMLAAYLFDPIQPEYYPSFFEQGQVGTSLQQILDRHSRVWLLTYTIGADNPINDVGLWLLSHSATSGGVWYGDNQLTLFLAPDQTLNSGEANTCQLMGQGRIKLCYSPLESTIRSDDPAAIALHWLANEKLNERYVVFVHALTAESPVPAAQQDSQPVNGLTPTFTWIPGESVTDLHALVLPSPPPGTTVTYQIHVGLYDADTQQRVPVDSGGDSVNIGTITVSNP